MNEKSIRPSESELKAAELAIYAIEETQTWTEETVATLIAEHTRHEGKTAKEWAELYVATLKNDCNEANNPSQGSLL